MKTFNQFVRELNEARYSGDLEAAEEETGEDLDGDDEEGESEEHVAKMKAAKKHDMGEEVPMFSKNKSKKKSEKKAKKKMQKESVDADWWNSVKSMMGTNPDHKFDDGWTQYQENTVPMGGGLPTGRGLGGRGERAVARGDYIDLGNAHVTLHANLADFPNTLPSEGRLAIETNNASTEIVLTRQQLGAFIHDYQHEIEKHQAAQMARGARPVVPTPGPGRSMPYAR